MDMTTLSGEMPRATMREVAALAGVGLKTVSRVVNGEPGVSDELTQRVRRAAIALDFRPNLAASHLRRTDRRTATVGVLLQDLSNPFSAGVLRAVEDVARERAVAVVAASVDEDADRERALVAALASRRVDGIVLAPASRDTSYLLPERRAGLQVVLADREPPVWDGDVVLCDNDGGARAATAHLLAQGHRRIAFVGDHPSITTALQRREGYRSALADAGVAPDDALVRLDVSSEAFGRAAVADMLGATDPPTAVFAAQNFITMGALRELRARGLGRSIALLGFDDFPLADLIDPAVSVVAQDVAEVGRHAARRLFARIDGDTGPAQRVVLPTRLVPRGSGEIRPAA